MALETATKPAFLDFGGRSGKSPDRTNAQRETAGNPAAFKRNHLMITSQSLASIERILARHAYGLEYVKMFSGMYPQRKDEVPDFVALCRHYGVLPYIGGGATELAQKEGRLAGFVGELQGMGIDTVEISNTDGHRGAAQCQGNIAALRRDCKHLLVEIGSKDDTEYQSLDLWQRDLDIALEQHADGIILEGAGSGRTGIYRHDGQPNTMLVTALAQRAGAASEKLLIEAPDVGQRAYWIGELFGWNVRLGNIPANKQHLDGTDRLRLDAMHPDTKQHILEHRLSHEAMLAALRRMTDEMHMPLDTAMFHGGLHGVRAVEQQHHDPHYQQLREFLTRLKGRSRSASPGSPVIIIRSVRGDLGDILRQIFGGDLDD